MIWHVEAIMTEEQVIVLASFAFAPDMNAPSTSMIKSRFHLFSHKIYFVCIVQAMIAPAMIQLLEHAPQLPQCHQRIIAIA